MKKFTLIFISIYLALTAIGCSSNPKIPAPTISGHIDDKYSMTLPKQCYIDEKTCIDEQTVYYLVIDGKEKAVYKKEYDKYSVGQQYP
jgi:hypothetical protein